MRREVQWKQLGRLQNRVLQAEQCAAAERTQKEPSSCVFESVCAKMVERERERETKGISAIYLSVREVAIRKNTNRARRREIEAMWDWWEYEEALENKIGDQCNKSSVKLEISNWQWCDLTRLMILLL